MRDVVAALVALLLVITAASLATTLQAHRRRRQRQRDSERALGRTIVTEIPAGGDFVLVTEDAARFYYGEQSFDKDLIVAVRVLINGAPLASHVSRRHSKAGSSTLTTTDAERGERPRLAPSQTSRGAASGGGAPRASEDAVLARQDRGPGAAGAITDHPEGIARDRWDVAVETVNGTMLIECGAIRERVSQELARKIFDAIKSELERRDAGRL